MSGPGGRPFSNCRPMILLFLRLTPAYCAQWTSVNWRGSNELSSEEPKALTLGEELEGSLAGEGPREDQKHDRRHAIQRYVTEVIVRKVVVISYCHRWSPPRSLNPSYFFTAAAILHLWQRYCT